MNKILALNFFEQNQIDLDKNKKVENVVGVINLVYIRMYMTVLYHGYTCTKNPQKHKFLVNVYANIFGCTTALLGYIAISNYKNK